MKCYVLIAATAAITIQPMASLPGPLRQAEPNRSAAIGERTTQGARAADRHRARTYNLPPRMLPARGRGGADKMLQRTEPMRDRCVPRRDAFRIAIPARAKRALDSPFRTPTFLPK